MNARARQPPVAGPPPSGASLREAALRYLARYAASEVGVTRVLERGIDRWLRRAGPMATEQAEAARALVPGVVASLARIGAIDDATFAASRARSLRRSGRSRRAVQAALAAKGVGAEAAAAALADAEIGGEAAERVAAARLMRKRRIGPFRATDVLPEQIRRELAMLARAGFSEAVARQALTMERDAAEALLAASAG